MMVVMRKVVMIKIVMPAIVELDMKGIGPSHPKAVISWVPNIEPQDSKKIAISVLTDSSILSY